MIRIKTELMIPAFDAGIARAGCVARNLASGSLASLVLDDAINFMKTAANALEQGDLVIAEQATNEAFRRVFVLATETDGIVSLALDTLSNDLDGISNALQAHNNQASIT